MQPGWSTPSSSRSSPSWLSPDESATCSVAAKPFCPPTRCSSSKQSSLRCPPRSARSSSGEFSPQSEAARWSRSPSLLSPMCTRANVGRGPLIRLVPWRPSPGCGARLYGAALVRFLDWRWQFWLNIPLALVGIGLAWCALWGHEESSSTEPRSARIDWVGAAALTAALVCLNVALLGNAETQSVNGLEELTGAPVRTFEGCLYRPCLLQDCSDAANSRLLAPSSPRGFSRQVAASPRRSS
jgi:hypothetical protein